MTQKTVGYVELEWTCKRCGTRNPGTLKKCASCGAPMAEEDRFEMPAEGKLIADAEKLAQAESGPDIHCAYCGARNPAGAEKCGQCGASLTEGKARQAGQVLGAFQAGPVPDVACPFCGTPNPASAVKCQKCGGALGKAPAQAATPAPAQGKLGLGLILAIVGGLVCVAAVIALILGGRTTDTPATVQSVAWERVIPVMAQGPVQHEAWQDSLPAGAQMGSCARKLRRTQSEPAAGAEEVCGTPYTKDQGSGIGKVVQDCEYRIYDQWCTYTVLEWTVVDQIVGKGNDLNPQWPKVSLAAGQREGDARTEKYQVVFKVEDKAQTYTYAPNDAGQFALFSAGSAWTLKVNTFGNVTDALPAQ